MRSVFCYKRLQCRACFTEKLWGSHGEKRENADKRDHYDTELPVTFRRLRGKRWE